MTALDTLVETLLWEGHQLYPYTPSATKNLTPTPFGIVYPPSYAAGDPHRFARLKVQAIATDAAAFSATVHCLVAGAAHTVDVTPGAGVAFALGSVGGTVAMDVEAFGPLRRVTVEVANTTDLADGASRADALEGALLSTHLVVRCAAPGRFFSPVAPPPEAAAAVMACVSVNTHPVLATEADDAILGAAIFLPDHPQIAPESRGSLFDGTEIEEALLLHVLALSDGERAELEDADPAVRAMLARAAAATPSDIMALHGRVTLSDPAPVEQEVRGEEAVVVGDRRFARGGHVVLRPGVGRVGATDHLLAGRSATIERIYIDYDGDVHLCVTVDDDPGQQLMRDIGRYLYFKPDEVEAP
ncbi:hypothetical protein DSM104299_03861 [Baekduia alba]|uniref:hypothetical protein n=1 Tax=Baekduia alba TaxID=2997333 RepID=UPI0023417887|nr:hypothetical protein [Baekduia alba]WCB95119.1 hypothetical protein DSM104299_03861 [Baekduia alba]